MRAMKLHPAARAFPLLDGEEFDELVEDIRKHGQRTPVVFDGELLLDGRNRIRACEKLGIDYLYEQWDRKGTAVDYVLSVNLHRRHLTPSQRSMVGAELLPAFKAEAKERQRSGQSEGGKKKAEKDRALEGKNTHKQEQPYTEPTAKPEPIRARDQAAKAVGVAPRYVDMAARVKDEAPELAEKVKQGEVTLPQAVRQIQGPTPQQDARSDPGRRFAEFSHKLYGMLNGLRDSGGIKQVIKRWTAEQRADWLKELRRLASEIDKWCKALEE